MAVLLLSLGVVPAKIWAIVAAQALIAALSAFVLKSERWWIAIHLAFSPLIVAALRLDIAPGWYLVGFLMLVAVYWTSFRTRVPLYLSNRETVNAVAALIPSAPPMRILDIGCGTGSLVVRLARLRPDCTLTGIEAAPLPYLISRLRAIGCPNLRIVRGDFFDRPWKEYDLVYAFLSPVPMTAVWDKARADLVPGSLLVSNSFPIQEVDASGVIEVGEKRGTQLFVYRVDK